MERKHLSSEGRHVVKSHFVRSHSCLILGRRPMERSEERGFTLDVCSSDEGGKTWKRQKMKQNSSSNFQKAPTQLLSGTELKLSVSFYSQTFINCLRNIWRNKDRTRSKDHLLFRQENSYFIRSSAALATKKILKITISWSELVFKVNSRSHQPHLFTFWYFKDTDLTRGWVYFTSGIFALSELPVLGFCFCALCWTHCY